jgi:hypothetical protein
MNSVAGLYIRLSEIKEMRREAVNAFLRDMEQHDQAEGLAPAPVLPEVLAAARQLPEVLTAACQSPPADEPCQSGHTPVGEGESAERDRYGGGLLVAAEPCLRVLCRTPQQVCRYQALF